MAAYIPLVKACKAGQAGWQGAAWQAWQVPAQVKNIGSAEYDSCLVVSCHHCMLELRPY